MADMLNNIGNVYRVSGEYAVSKVFYSEASRIFSDNSNFYKLMISNSNIAAVCMDMSDYTAAQQYLTKAEEISTTNNYDYLPLKTNRLHLLLKINKPDEAGKLITAESNYTISDKYLSSFYYVKGLYYLNANNYQKAIDYVDKALTIDKQNEHFNSIGEDLLCLGNIYLKMGNPEPAYRFYDRSYNIFILIHNHPKSEIARSYKNRISDIFPGFIPDTTISNYFSEKWKKNIFHASPCD
jgi:tetratricopeptide (TPR) repeat protein